MARLQVRDIVLGKGQPKVVIPLTGTNLDEIMEQATIAKKVADIVEWRVDFFKEVLDDEKVLIVLLALRDELRDIPLLFTFRTKEEGGEQELLLKDYKVLYELAVTSRTVDIVDIELSVVEQIGSTFVSWVKALDVLVLMSNHDFEKTPPESVLMHRLLMMEHFGASIAKIAMMPNEKKDVLNILNVTMKAEDVIAIPVVTMSMGQLGMASRLVGQLTGSVMTFGTAGHASAPGQVPVSQLREILELLAKK